MTDHQTSPVGEDAATEFEAWWDREGQYIRAGGGQYEKSFAYGAWNARRAAHALDASGLPPLPAWLTRLDKGKLIPRADAIKAMQQYGLDSITADRQAGAAPTQPKAKGGASIDTPEFRALLADFGHNWTNGDEAQKASRAALIAHIDAWAGSRAGDAVPDGWKLVPVDPTLGMMLAFREAYQEPSATILTVYSAFLAAAPAPGKQAGNDQADDPKIGIATSGRAEDDPTAPWCTFKNRVCPRSCGKNCKSRMESDFEMSHAPKDQP